MYCLHQHTQLSKSILDAKRKNTPFGAMMNEVRSLLRAFYPADRAARVQAEQQLSDSLYPAWGRTEEAVRSALASLLGETQQENDGDAADQHDAGPLSQEETFLRAAAANPGARDTWLAYADWLEEQGRSEDGAWFRSREFLAIWEGSPAAFERQRTAFERDQEHVPQLPALPPLHEVLRSFSPEQWRALENLQEPTLVLVPPLDFDQCIELLNRHSYTSAHYPVHVGDLYRTHEHPAPRQWQAFFVEGESNMPLLRAEETEGLSPQQVQERERSVRRMPLGDRLAAEEKTRAQPMRGIDRYIYAWLMLASLERSAVPQEQLDNEAWTLLNADNMWVASNRSGVPAAHFYPEGRRVDFDWHHADGDVPSARLRRAVGGDVPAPL